MARNIRDQGQSRNPPRRNRGRGRARGNNSDGIEPAREHLGHNSSGTVVDGEALRRYRDRVLRVEEERKVLGDDIKEIYAEAREAGFVTKILRQMVREAGLDPQVRQDMYDLLDTYRAALGMLAGTPLGDAAMQQAGFEMDDPDELPPAA